MTSSVEEGPIEIPKPGLILLIFVAFALIGILYDHQYDLGSILPLILTIYAGCEAIVLYLVAAGARRKRDSDSAPWLTRFINRMPERMSIIGFSVVITSGLLLTIGVDWQQSIKLGLIVGIIPPLTMVHFAIKRWSTTRACKTPP